LSDCIIDDQKRIGSAKQILAPCRGCAAMSGGLALARGCFGVPATSIVGAALFIFREPHSNYCAST